MVLAECKDEATGGLFIDITEGEGGALTLTALTPTTAHTATLTVSCACVVRWAGNLQLSTEQYLQQLLAAVSSTAADSHSQKQQQNGAGAEQSERPEHVFEISKGNLSWRQYFADKKVHGKRGVIPLQEASHSSAAWSVLQAAAQQQQATLQRVQAVQRENTRLRAEHAAAEEMARRSVELKEQFQQQSYAKFCQLLNAKKDKIQQLQDRLQQLQAGGAGTGSNNNTSSDNSSTADAPIQPPSAKPPGRLTATAHLRAGGGVPAPVPSSEDEFDVDTDVDDVEGQDTDEEREARSSRARATTRKPLLPGAGAASSKRKSDGSRPGHLASKRPTLLLDSSQDDDLFDSSMEGEARVALMNNIKPSGGGRQVSRVLGDRRGGSLGDSSSGGKRGVVVSSEQQREESGGKDKNGDGKRGGINRRDAETVSFVASILERNVRERLMKGYEMPKRADDFDFVSSTSKRYTSVNDNSLNFVSNRANRTNDKPLMSTTTAVLTPTGQVNAHERSPPCTDEPSGDSEDLASCSPHSNGANQPDQLHRVCSEQSYHLSSSGGKISSSRSPLVATTATGDGLEAGEGGVVDVAAAEGCVEGANSSQCSHNSNYSQLTECSDSRSQAAESPKSSNFVKNNSGDYDSVDESKRRINDGRLVLEYPVGSVSNAADAPTTTGCNSWGQESESMTLASRDCTAGGSRWDTRGARVVDKHRGEADCRRDVDYNCASDAHCVSANESRVNTGYGDNLIDSKDTVRCESGQTKGKEAPGAVAATSCAEHGGGESTATRKTVRQERVKNDWEERSFLKGSIIEEFIM